MFTYLLTPWCRVLPEQLTGLQLVKKFPTFHGTRRFITTLTNVRQLPPSWASPIQSIYPHPTSWRSVLILSIHLRLGLPSGLFPSGFPNKTLYTPFPQTGSQLLKKFPAFHGTRKFITALTSVRHIGSILGQPNPVHIPTSHLLEIHPNIIHPSTPSSLQWSPSLRFPHQDSIHPPLLTLIHFRIPIERNSSFRSTLIWNITQCTVVIPYHL